MAQRRILGFAIRSALAVLALPFSAHASFDAGEGDLPELSLEQLMNVEVTTVAGTGHARFTLPAALYVITAEDIRRSGHRTIAEEMRLVPGMYVARIDSNRSLVGARGLTGSTLTASRYLVLNESYARVDVGLAWKPDERMRLALWGQNLLEDSHREGSAIDIPRSFLVQLSPDF